MATMRSYYRYDPSLPAAIVVSVLYSLAFVGTAVQWLRYKSWVWIIMVLTAGSKCDLIHNYPSMKSREAKNRTVVEAGGHVVRCISTQNIADKDIYVVQFSLVVLAPVLIAAACYVIFVRPHQNLCITTKRPPPCPAKARCPACLCAFYIQINNHFFQHRRTKWPG